MVKRRGRKWSIERKRVNTRNRKGSRGGKGLSEVGRHEKAEKKLSERKVKRRERKGNKEKK